MESVIHLAALSTLLILQILCFLGGIKEVGGTCSRTFECPTGDSGSIPVCGSDRRTYSSRCTLQLAKCNGHRVRMAYKGNCKGTRPPVPRRSHNLVASMTTKCQQERQEALSNARAKDLIMLGVFAPKCEADGSFSRVQCLNSSGYCWCVDNEGKEMPGTKVRQWTPDCPTIAYSQPSEKPSGKGWKAIKPCIDCKGCSRNVRTTFNDKLVKFLSKEFMDYVQRSASSSGQVQGQSSSMGKVHLLLWKFTHLDTNADYLLEMKELHALLKVTKKTIHPKKCSRTFMAYCDRDRDHKISLNEWYMCFGVKEIKKCSGEYLAAIQASKYSSSENQPYLPRCATDGSFTPTQCHYSIGYCWCVDIDTGKPIPNTTTKATSLDCWKYMSKQQNSTGLAKKECAQDLWTSFRRHMLRLFRREVEEDSPKNEDNPVESIRNQRRSARSGNLQHLGTFLSDNQVLIWKFNRLDKNKDKLLVSSEFLTSTMKKILGNIKRGRKCGKKLLVDCDLDKDRGLSMMEWTLCLRTNDRRMPLQ